MSYQIPTYQSIKGICESIYWKPTIVWYPTEIRVMKPIQTESKGIRPIEYNGGNTLAYYTYLRDPCYLVKAHFEFNPHRSDLEFDRNEEKHHNIAKRALVVGGRRDIFLGSRECQGYVEPCDFEEEKGHYDDYPGEINFGTMVHGINYPDETGRNELEVRLWQPVMKKGIISFIRPEECTLIKKAGEMIPKLFDDSNVQSVDDLIDELK